MEEFIEKWKTDKKFKAKAQLCIYCLFIILLVIYVMIGQKTNTPKEPVKDTYVYQMSINLNDRIYTYNCEKKDAEITINKTLDNITTNYIYKDNIYYKIEENNYNIVTEEEIFGKIKYSYLSLDTINKYLKISILTEDKNIVYLKDIILGEDSEKAITIEQKDNSYKIDYTELMKLFHKDIEKLTVEIIIG